MTLSWLPIIIAGLLGYFTFACLVARALRTARSWHDDIADTDLLPFHRPVPPRFPDDATMRRADARVHENGGVKFTGVSR